MKTHVIMIRMIIMIIMMFNEAGCDEEPCREHADPGLLTVLCRSTNEALQVYIPQRGGAVEAGCSDLYGVIHDFTI